ncbi:MAG: Gfo/Idh/MocA family oxidoreductase [Cytophagales bacterium]|nr:Gfo/Idh/MocA family oxidoreductase [Cytophagales bacterium]
MPIIIATSDHWHDRISIEAMNKGKHVYCEKPMVHKLDEGAEVIATQKKTGKVFQVGSQRVSSIVTLKAKEVFETKTIGDLIMVETWMDRHSANGAWQYSIPTDAQGGTVDWDSFQGDAPKRPYDPTRFFRWRNYQDYGTGVAGDLFVHLFFSITCGNQLKRTESNSCDRWLTDIGRMVAMFPDVILGIYDYPATDKHPAFNLQMRVNFVDGSERGEGLRLIGTDGYIDFGWDYVKVVHHKMRKEPGFGGWDSYETFSESQQKEYEKWYRAKYPKVAPQIAESDLEYKAPRDYNANLDHHAAFYKGIRQRRRLLSKDALFGMRAAGPALATNKSYFDKTIINWDPVQAKLV